MTFERTRVNVASEQDSSLSYTDPEVWASSSLPIAFLNQTARATISYYQREKCSILAVYLINVTKIHAEFYHHRHTYLMPFIADDQKVTKMNY